jgi:hypothetical protein
MCGLEAAIAGTTVPQKKEPGHLSNPSKTLVAGAPAGKFRRRPGFVIQALRQFRMQIPPFRKSATSFGRVYASDDGELI